MALLLTPDVAKHLLALRAEGAADGSSSLDLNLTISKVHLLPEGVSVRSALITWDAIEKVAGAKRKVYICEGDELKEASVFSEQTGWVRALTPTTGAPTVLVSGIPMHRIKDTDPHRDTLSKVEALKPIKGRVLDTATGLGYTAIELAKYATEVVTVELDPAAIEVAKMNPWSAGLFSSLKIKQVIGDIEDEIDSFRNGEFSAILHDPPTIQLAGGLYSGEFYEKLRRVLGRQGKLFHYVGDPNSGLGSRMTQGVIKRLNEAGFRRVVRKPEAFGVVALS